MIIFYLCLFILAVYILVKSGALAVSSLLSISRYLKISEYVLAFITMAIATSLPEFFIGIGSAVSEAPILSLGNVIGSNIVNLSLVLGIIILFAKGVEIKSKIAKKSSWLTSAISILPLALLLDKNLSRIDGIILLIVFTWYLKHILKTKESFREKLDGLKKGTDMLKKFRKSITSFFMAVIVLLLSSWGVVKIATLIAAGFNFQLVVVGLILVAVGTSLPELVFGIKAIMIKHEGMNLGNLIGSTVINSTLVIGLTAIIYPIRIESFNNVLVGGFFMFLSIMIVNFFIATKERISRKQGILLIGIYVLFLITETLLK